MKTISTKQRLAGLKIRCNYGGAGSRRHKKDMSESEWAADTESRKNGIKTQLNDTLNSGLDIAFNKDLSNDNNFQDMKNYADHAAQGFFGSINNEKNGFNDSEIQEAAYNTAESLKAMANEAKKAGRTDKEVNSIIQDSNRIANLAPSYYDTEESTSRNEDDDDTYRGSMGWG